MTIIASILPYIQIALSIVLIALVLLQRSEAGLGGAFGGGDGFSSGFHTRRGLEKTLFIGTIVVAGLFVVASFLSFFLK
ncbi:MAG: preprotein translocase subunit SecG [Candidatus Paceibacterota bacterium]